MNYSTWGNNSTGATTAWCWPLLTDLSTASHLWLGYCFPLVPIQTNPEPEPRKWETLQGKKQWKKPWEH